MPVVNGDSGEVAFDKVCENLSSPTFETAVGARNSDIEFLSALMNSTIVQSLVKTHDTLENTASEPVSCDNIELVKETLDEVDAAAQRSRAAKELKDIMSNPHFKALIYAHDDVAAKNYDEFPEFAPVFMPPQQSFTAPNEAVRMVGVRKNAEEPLGITVATNEKGLIISRILKGGTIERDGGLLHIGDVILEINGQEVTDPDQLQEMMKKSHGSVTFKILPSISDFVSPTKVYLKAHFNYDPKRDNLVPCRDAGLPFNEGDILEVVSRDDVNWWQAKKITADGPSGLIPSQTLEEKRKAFVRPEYDYTHKSLLCGIVTKKKKVPTATLR